MVNKITKTKIIRLFANNYEKRYYLREIASLLKKPHQTVKPYVESLTKERILIKNQRKNIVEYTLNFNNNQLIDYLVIAEKERLIKRLNEDTLLKTFLEKISAYFIKNTFLIFGSSTEKIQRSSDIDLLIIGNVNKSRIEKSISEFEKIYNKKIHKVQISDLSKLTHALTKEIYKKHLIFNNTEQIVRFFVDLHEKNKLV